jgi:hypothetical protein
MKSPKIKKPIVVIKKKPKGKLKGDKEKKNQ